MKAIIFTLLLATSSALAKDYSISVKSSKYEPDKIIISIETENETVDFIEKDPGDNQEALQVLVKKVITDYKRITSNGTKGK